MNPTCCGSPLIAVSLAPQTAVRRHSYISLYDYIAVWLLNRTMTHSPKLDTMLMVEKQIYLEASNKIIYKEDKIVWVAADNPKLKQLFERSVKLR
jgi:hypothetical protein